MEGSLDVPLALKAFGIYPVALQLWVNVELDSRHLVHRVTKGGIFKIDGPSVLLLVLPFGVSLVLSPGIRVPVLVGIGATVAPPPMATPKFGVGTPNTGDAPTCGRGK